MKVIALKGDLREATGKSSTKRLRNEGKVPCVVYGSDDIAHFSVYQADFKNLVYTPNTYLVQLNLGESHRLAKIQDLQFHPVSEDIIHADFYEIDPSKPLTVAIPVKIVGNSPGVRMGGQLQLKIKKLLVSGMVQDLPEFIEVNINGLELSKSIKVKDISAANLELLDPVANSIVSCIVTRAARSAAGTGGSADEEETSEEESSEGGSEE